MATNAGRCREGKSSVSSVIITTVFNVVEECMRITNAGWQERHCLCDEVLAIIVCSAVPVCSINQPAGDGIDVEHAGLASKTNCLIEGERIDAA